MLKQNNALIKIWTEQSWVFEYLYLLIQVFNENILSMINLEWPYENTINIWPAKLTVQECKSKLFQTGVMQFIIIFVYSF